MSQENERPSYVTTAEEIMALGITEVPMLCAPILSKEGIASLCGSSDGGKSYLCLCLAIAICSDHTEVLGLGLNKTHGSAIIVCTEDAAGDICVRLRALLGERTPNEGKLRFIFETEDIVKKIKRELARQPADMVIMDTFGDLFAGNLNNSIDIRQFLGPYKKLAKRKQCLFLFCHHIGKGKENNPVQSKNDVLGSQSIESACRTVLMLKKRPDGKRVLTIVKGNNVPDHLKDRGMIFDFDPSAGFSPTGETVVSSHADQSATAVSDTGPTLAEQVVTLYQQEKSYKKVADALKTRGHKVDKNRVGVIWRTNRPSVPNPKE